MKYLTWWKISIGALVELVIDFMPKDQNTNYHQFTFQQPLKFFKLKIVNYILLNFKK
jgi:hypothetical protein